MRMALILASLLATAPVRAETTATWKPPAPPRHRKIGLGLIAGGGLCLALGAVFTGLAAKSNGDALAGMQYHPTSEDATTSYQIADGVFFLAGGAAVVSGVVLLW